MENNKLIGMTDFVLQQSKGMEEQDSIPFSYEVIDYAKFLKQPLKLEYFVPCYSNGEPIKKPDAHKVPEMSPELQSEYWNEWNADYDKGLEKVLFEGFEFEKDNGTWFHIVKNDNNLNWRKDGGYFEFFKGYDIEKISRYIDLTLTPSAIKKLGL